MRLPRPDKSGLAMTFRETGSMHRTPTLGKTRKEKDGHDSSCPYIKERKEGTGDGSLFLH